MSEYDTALLPVLKNATNAELAPLVEYITKAMNNSLDSESRYKTHYPQHNQYVDLIDQELRAFGGNTFVNLFRGGGPAWKVVVIDVADKLDAKYEESWPVERIELAVLAAITRKAWKEMDEGQRKDLLTQMDLTAGTAMLFPEESLMTQLTSSRFSSLMLASLIANVFASQILGKTIAMTAASFVASRGAASFIGPVGWVVTGLWTAFDLSGPAYRITVPAVAQVALLRQRINASAEVDKNWNDYHRWQDSKDADSWASVLFKSVGLSTSARVKKERETAFAQGHSAGYTQATEDYSAQVMHKMNELNAFEKRCEIMLGIAFACAQSSGVSAEQVRCDIETCCLGMMGGQLSSHLNNVITDLIKAPPSLAEAIQKAVAAGIPAAQIDAMLMVLQEAFAQTAAQA
ncbi:ubiquinol-cytochrome C chaperone family protein [Enterobacter sp.]|uniref:YaaW family protein n=1 Tax=Enterobacter sp. TaxID=42895 RepID=UPI00296E3C72|nr:ubiquinol-cytochrome C chaperone family protein [Enterobacter sp.]